MDATADPDAVSLRELNRWLRNYAGIDPTSKTSSLEDLACVGATIVMWRNGPLEDVHAREPGIRNVEMFRANTATWAHVRAAFVGGGDPSWSDVAARIADPGRSLTGQVPRRSPGGVTLADLIPDEADRSAVAAHAADQADLLAAVDDVVGRPRVLRALAAFGAAYGSGWLGTPWWGLAALAFADGAHGEAGHPRLAPSMEPPEDVVALLPDHKEFRSALASRPYVLPLDVLAWCLRAGLSDVVDFAQQCWLQLKAPDRPSPGLLTSPERMRFGGWPMAAPLPTQWIRASRRPEPADRSP